MTSEHSDSNLSEVFGGADPSVPPGVQVLDAETFLALLDRAVPDIGDVPAEGADPVDHVPYAPGTGESVLNPTSHSEVELARRQHIVGFVLDLIDTRKSRDERVAALEHLLVCDPLRAIGSLAQLAGDGVEMVAAVSGGDRHSAIDSLRSALADSMRARAAGTDGESA